MSFDLQAVLRSFIAESREAMDRVEECLLALEQKPGDHDLLHTVFRAAHTLKGNAVSLGFPKLADFAHRVEDFLEKLLDGSAACTPEVISVLLQIVDAVRTMVPAAVEGQDELRPEHEAMLRRLEGKAGKKAAANAATPADQTTGAALAPRSLDHTLRVPIERLDRMLNLAGEIAIAQARLRGAIEKLGDRFDDLATAHDEVERLYLDIQEQVMKLRMVPVGPVFRQYVRTVRDLARAQHKQARLEIEGEDVELDTSVIEHIRDPLLHMVRNAVDHGIESPERRRAAGKDPCGRVLLRALHEAGSIVIQLSDDGAGFDRQRILARARERGVLNPGDQPGDSDLFRLVFEAGFSTAEKVTEVSGRGVGMDVVRRNIDALRGSVMISSRAGEGSTITIRLPLTLAIIEGFSVAIGGEIYILPLDSVVECLDIEATSQAYADGVVNVRGEALPYIRLGRLFGAEAQRNGRESVVVVEHEGGRIGVAVDQLMGECQAVIKPLGALFQNIPGIGGSTILEDGRVGLIVDVSGLVRNAIDFSARAAAQ